MSELTHAPNTAPAPVENTAAGKRPNPLKQLPEDWRGSVSFFYAAYSDLLKSPLGLVTRLRYFIETDGLTLEEMKIVLKWAIQPEQQARFEYVGQLLAGIARKVSEVVERRKQAEKTRARRDQTEQDRTNRDTVTKLTDSIGKPDPRKNG